MITCLAYHDGRVIRVAPETLGDKLRPLWIDMIDPTLEEVRLVDALLGVALPTLEEMKEIEISSRLYEENHAQYMTMTYVAHALEEKPESTQITFVVKRDTLVSLRYVETRLMSHFISRVEGRAEDPYRTPGAILTALLDNIIDYWADVLEHENARIETMSQNVFAARKTDYQAMLQQMGHIGSLNSKLQEALVSAARLLAYAGHTVVMAGEMKARLANLGGDVQSLLDQAGANTGKLAFLLDATLGLVNIEQNAIIKIFSVAAVIFMPPTLIASIYGMNFHHMPELAFVHGYPIALGLMVLSAATPYWFFKHKGWL